MEVTSILALFVLLLLSSATFFAAKRLRIPYTVLLVLVGIVLVPLVELPAMAPLLGFLNDVVLTPELLFYIFLPMLIFESAFNMNMRRMVENSWHIMLLAIVGLMISAILIAAGLYFGLQAIGLPIPFLVALLFGAIISSTDPVAVLALFKEYGAPKRLTLIFEGESLFNDGTAVALFLVVLAVATEGFHGTGTILEGIGTFAMMLLAGIAFGLLMAAIFSRALRFTRSNEFVSITVLIVSAHIVFILSELINAHPIFGLHLHVSAIIATTVSALFLGNYARHILSPRSDDYLKKSIEHLAFVANSLVFLLAGILFASTSVDFSSLWLPILLTIIIVAVARAISVYAVTVPLNKFKPELAIPSAWQKLLAWGSLRGALAIIVVLLIPDDFAPAGWNYDYTAKELLLALTIGCILATLLIKATTIGKLVTKLGANKPTLLQRARTNDLALYYLLTEQARITDQQKRGYLSKAEHAQLCEELKAKLQAQTNERAEIKKEAGHSVFARSLHYSALMIEDKYLKELYANGELSEMAYRKIKGKLTLQQEKIEYAQHENINPSSYIDRKDIFERLVLFIHTVFDRSNDGTRHEETYQYYRGQSIIARKVVKTLTDMQSQYRTTVFDPDAYDKVLATYQKHYETAHEKAQAILSAHADELAAFTTALARRSLYSSGQKSLRFMSAKGLADETMLEHLEHTLS